MRLLVVEDEVRIASFLVKGLSAQGYDVDAVATGSEALVRGRDPGLDLLILDLGLPDVDGLEVLRRLRREGRQLPVIILTARAAVEGLVEGLALGADDYLTKPFAFDELLARVRARLRSHRNEDAFLEVWDVRLDARTRRAEINGTAVALNEREYALLETLVRRANKVVSRKELLAEVWGLSFYPRTDILDVYVDHLRRKIGENRIETVPDIGYRFSANGSAQPE
jgi:DNA-binding response OmpR family regulator